MKPKYEGEVGRLKTFEIEATWVVRGKIHVNAYSLDDAILKVEENNGPETATDKFKGVYMVDDTFKIDRNDCCFERHCDADEKETP